MKEPIKHVLDKKINGLFMVIDIICPLWVSGSQNICESRWSILSRAYSFLLDYRLNPVLRKACKADIPKFCHGILTKAKDDSELEGQVISCLKLRYADQVNCPGLCTRPPLVPSAFSLEVLSFLPLSPRPFSHLPQARAQVES